MDKKFSLDGLLPGLTFDTDEKTWKDQRQQMKEMLKDTKNEMLNSVKGMDDVQKFIFDVAEKSTEHSPLPPKDAMDIPEAHLESLYSLAHSLYESGKYDESANMFRLLIMIDHFEYKYIFGLAASMQMQEEYFKAATTYIMAATIDTTTPLPHYHASECYLKLHDPGSACISLGLAIDAAGKQKQYETLKERCMITKERLMKFLKKKMKQKKLDRLKKSGAKKRKKIKKKVEKHV